MAAKEQEKKALEKIREIVDSLTGWRPFLGKSIIGVWNIVPFLKLFILQTAWIYSGVPGKVPG